MNLSTRTTGSPPRGWGRQNTLVTGDTLAVYFTFRPVVVDQTFIRPENNGPNLDFRIMMQRVRIRSKLSS